MSESVYCRGCGAQWEEDPFLSVPCARCGAGVHEPCAYYPEVHRARKILAWEEGKLCPCMKQALAETVRRMEKRQAKQQAARQQQPELNLFSGPS